MNGLTHLPGCGSFTEYMYFPAARPRTTLAFLHLKTLSQKSIKLQTIHIFKKLEKS